MHAAVDVVAGFFLYLITWFHASILQWLNRQLSRLGALRRPGHVEAIWNILIVALMLQIAQRSVPPAVVLGLYFIFWVLARLGHASVVQVMPTSAERPPLSRARANPMLRIWRGPHGLSAISNAQ
jgi:hypothetical protein